MRTKTWRTAIAVVAAGLTLGVSAGTAGAAEVTNGSFEDGDFTGWTADSEAGSAGDWFVNAGTSSPINEDPVPAPPCGTFAAVGDTQENTASILYQDIALEADQTHLLTLQYFYVNYAPGFATPDQLAIEPDNQQYRIDIMDPAADPYSATAPAVLLPIFRTDVGDPNDSGGWQTLAVDLSAYAGQTVRLRFGFTTSDGYMNPGADCVEVQSTPIPTTTVAPTTTQAAAATVTPAFTG